MSLVLMKRIFQNGMPRNGLTKLAASIFAQIFLEERENTLKLNSNKTLGEAKVFNGFLKGVDNFKEFKLNKQDKILGKVMHYETKQGIFG